MAQLGDSWLSVGRLCGALEEGFVAQSCGEPKHHQCAGMDLYEQERFTLLLLRCLKSLLV